MTWMFWAVLWLLCLAVVLDMADRAPVMEDE
jgi:hypothetical protein